MKLTLVLAALIAGAPPPSPSPAPSTAVVMLPGKPLPLRFKPHAELRYEQSVTDIRVELVAGKEPAATKTDARSLMRRTVTAKGESLAVEDVFTADEAGKPEQRGTLVMDARGRPLGAGGKPVETRPTQLVLRDEPLPTLIAIFGQPSFGAITWSAELKAHAQLPADVRTEYEVLGTEVAAGRECVVIASSGRGNATISGGKERFEYFGRSRVLFDPLQGIVVTSETVERIDIAQLPVPVRGLLRTHTETLVKRSLVRP